MTLYLKAIIAFFGGLGTWGGTALADGQVDGVEWFGLCGVVVMALAVFQVPNYTTDSKGRRRGSDGRFT